MSGPYIPKGLLSPPPTAEEIKEAVADEVAGPDAAFASPPTDKKPGNRRDVDKERGAGLIEKRGLGEQVVWLKACEWSNTQIARFVGVSISTLERYIRQPTFKADVERRVDEVLARVQDKIIRRLEGMQLECLETRVTIMRDKRAHHSLRDAIAKSLMEMYREYKAGGGGSTDDSMKGMFEVIERFKSEGGRTIEKRARIEGPPAAVAALRDAVESQGGGETPGTDDPTSPIR